MRVAANSPAWLTRKAASRNSFWRVVRAFCGGDDDADVLSSSFCCAIDAVEANRCPPFLCLACS